MSIIRTHNVTLDNGDGLVLRPLCDDHFALLYKWNADPEVVYWSEEDEVTSNSVDTVHMIYGVVSQCSYCFLIEYCGVPIGECWLQEMNLQNILALYPNKDVRRIDMMIGEKDYWQKGLGTQMVAMLVKFAFEQQATDVVCGLLCDYNIRSRKTFERNGFTMVLESPIGGNKKTKSRIALALNRENYFS